MFAEFHSDRQLCTSDSRTAGGSGHCGLVHTCVQLFCSCENCASKIEKEGAMCLRTIGALAHVEELKLLKSKPANH